MRNYPFLVNYSKSGLVIGIWWFVWISKSYNHFILLIWKIFTPALADGFSLDSEWQQISSNLQDSSQYSNRSQQNCSLDGTHSSSYFLQSQHQSLVILPSTTITTDITVTLMFHRFFSSLARSKFLFLFLLSSLVYRECQSPLIGSFFFLLTISRSGHLAEIWWYVYIWKSHRILSVLCSWTDSRLCIYHLFVWSNLNFLHNSQWITFPSQSYTVFVLIYGIRLLSLLS